MRLRAKKDDNHNQIANAFRRLGWSWKDTHQLGDGFPDGVAGIGGHYGINILVEIKDGAKTKSRRKLTTDEIEFHTIWTGPLRIIESIEDVVRLHNIIVKSDRSV